MRNFLIGIGILTVLVALLVINYACDYAGRTAAVVDQQIDPAVLQQKYEWFKDAAAQLDKKQADIKVYQARINEMKKIPNLDRTDREQLMVWQQELAGVKASYNGLAAEYNAQMSKWNWRFCNVGDLPKGATEPLPREFKPYEEQ